MDEDKTVIFTEKRQNLDDMSLVFSKTEVVKERMEIYLFCHQFLF